ncbi:MAG: hypothetical protein JNL11_01550 [Bdellovibrionaceae bacterium]|nr:hypothetical protein [Pseudobdellovibrionaceae bacterium]
MAFENLRENLKTQFDQLGERITNSSVYQLLNERYENLSSARQRLVKIVTSVLALSAFIYIPMGSFLTSFENETAFEKKRKFIKDIIRSEREVSALPDIPRPLPAEAIRSTIESKLKDLNFIPEQIKHVAVNYSINSPLIPQNKIQYGIDVSVHKINVKQLTNLGSSLQLIHSSVKVKDMTITLNREDARYLNADFKLVALNIPEYTPPLPPPPEPKKKGSTKKNTKSEDGEG